MRSRHLRGFTRSLFPTAVLLLPLVLVDAVPLREQPHIILISVDTLRADHLGAYGYRGSVTPFLDSLANQGLLFENTYVPLPQTGPSHASLLTSVLPWTHRVTKNGMVLSPDVDTLAAALARAGYDTAGAVAASQIGRTTGFSRGFQRFTCGVSKTPDDAALRDADAINADAHALINAHLASHHQQPLFLFIHYFDCHYPYRWWDRNEKTENPWSLEVQSNRNMQIQRYDDGVRRVDVHIRQLYQYAVRTLGPNLIFCVTADHGEQIGDHGVLVGHADIYRETVAVPLILAGPGISVGRVTTAVSNMDVAVTLARLAGATFSNPVDGRDLFTVAEDNASWLHRMFNKAPPRSFIVVGSPAYTRSIALIEGQEWYIKNFDRFYRDGWIETPVPEKEPDTSVKVAPMINEGAANYRIPYRSYRPYLVSLVHVAKDPDCAMTATATLAPGVRYWSDPIPFKRSIRIVLPAARLDSVTLSVSPSTCAGQTTYHVMRFEDSVAAPPSARRSTTLFENLYAPRKVTSADELFRMDRDAAMATNLVGTIDSGSLAAKLRALYEEAAVGSQDGKTNVEELRKLRSLGYLQ
jgi:arylsulfatase A-like enzyme